MRERRRELETEEESGGLKDRKGDREMMRETKRGRKRKRVRVRMVVKGMAND